MALPVRQQLIYWGIATAVFLFIMWTLGNVILPFLVGGAIAYFLDPVADRLEKMGMSRIVATIVVFAFLIVISVLGALLVIPMVVQQTIGLVQAAPGIIDALREAAETRFPSLMEEDSPLQYGLSSLGDMVRERSGQLLQGLLSSAAGVANTLVFLVIVPVVAFYMLMDWDKMVARVDELLPRDHQPVIRDLARQIDETLASFIRGQGTVCLILGAFYAIALMIVGLQFGVVAGLIAGLLTFIPYVGALVGGVLSVGLALFQFWGDWWMILIVALIFQVGQFVEGNILTPNLVGSSISLHPVWLLFALSAFGAVFGFAGLLVAVPVAAAIGVLVRYAIGRYREGLLYNGTSPRDPAADTSED